MSKLYDGPFADPIEDWSKIDNSELRTRLLHRGCDAAESKILVAGRGDRNIEKAIAEYLLDPAEPEKG